MGRRGCGIGYPRDARRKLSEPQKTGHSATTRTTAMKVRSLLLQVHRVVLGSPYGLSETGEPGTSSSTFTQLPSSVFPHRSFSVALRLSTFVRSFSVALRLSTFVRSFSVALRLSAFVGSFSVALRLSTFVRSFSVALRLSAFVRSFSVALRLSTFVRSFSVALRPQRPYELLGTGNPARPPRLSHKSWALNILRSVECCFTFTDRTDY